MSKEKDKLRERFKTKEGQTFTITERGFYMTVKDGKISIPRNILEDLDLQEGTIVEVKIGKA